MEVNVQLHAPLGLTSGKELQVHSEEEAGRSRGPNRIPDINPSNPELNPICSLLALLDHHFLHVSRIRVKQESFVPVRNRTVRWSGQ